MPYLLVKQKIIDFERWYAVFKSEAKAQKESGLHDIIIFREIIDENLIVCLFKIDNLEKAKAFTDSQKNRGILELSGTTGEPEILFLDKA
ncbi:MAG: hypothetical protein WCA84_20705 [Ignavibacteriaceae bacterium]|jgi:hypothetical protein